MGECFKSCKITKERMEARIPHCYHSSLVSVVSTAGLSPEQPTQPSSYRSTRWARGCPGQSQPHSSHGARGAFSSWPRGSLPSSSWWNCESSWPLLIFAHISKWHFTKGNVQAEGRRIRGCCFSVFSFSFFFFLAFSALDTCLHGPVCPLKGTLAGPLGWL